jgi:dihydroorotate dehydrogenase (NAD+) catalytic subunit
VRFVETNIMSTLSTTFLGTTFSNPIVLASGIMGISASSLGFAMESGAGGVTNKSITIKVRMGHKNPTVIGFPGGMLNAVGLSGEGIEDGIKELQLFRKRFPEAPLIASFFGETIEQFGEVAALLGEVQPSLIEVDMSCPNTADELGAAFACSPDLAVAVTAEVRRATTYPISVKLAPNVPNLAEIARSVEAVGADAITAINTMPGMLIDVEMGRPVLKNKSGGMSGPALKPIALKCVYDIYRAVKIPIIGTGGVSTGRDALEMIMAGATLVGVGSAVWQQGMDVFAQITTEMLQLMTQMGWQDLAQVRGLAHQDIIKSS